MITIPTIDSLESGILAYFTSAFPNADLGPYSYLGQWARSLAQALLGIYQGVQDADRDSIPNAQTSSSRLDEFAILFGVPDGSGVAGQYGRKRAIAATGGTANLYYSGASGTPYTLPTSQTWLAPDGLTIISLASAEVYAAAGTQAIDLTATTAGTGGNLPIPTVLVMQSPPSGFPSTVTLTGALSGGVDIETDDALLTRILERLQNPPKAITAPDLRTLAQSAPGIYDAYVYPRRSGTGSADVVPMLSGAGTGRRPTAAQIVTVQDILDENRNVSAQSITAYRPTASTAHAVAVRATAASQTPWDWNADNSWSGTVDTYPVGGDVLKLKLSTIAPDDLKAAITASRLPVIQIPVSGTVLPATAQCTAWADGGGKTTLTLKAAPTVAPIGGEAVYAGASWVSAVETEVIDYVNQLGPSRYSGFADPLRYWEDTLRVDQIRRIVLSAADDSGQRYLTLTVSTLIDGAATDIQAIDLGGSNPPEYLILSSVVVRP